MKYERPDLEELELELEGSFLEPKTDTTDKEETPGGGGDGEEGGEDYWP